MLQDYLGKNLELLSAHHKGTFNFIKIFLNRFKESDYIVSETKNASVTLSVSDSEGKSFLYHSRYNPEREALQIVEGCFKNETHAVVIGNGLGYSAELLLDRLPRLNYGSQLFIIEPDPFVFIASLKYRNLTKLLSDNRVVFYFGTDAAGISEQWSNALDWSVMEGLAVVEHQPTKSRFADFFVSLLGNMKHLANRSRGNLVTLMNVGSEFHTNNFMNLPEAFFLPGADRLFDKFKGIPAIVVAAGPSLDKNIDLLKKIKGRFPIIAVDTALRHMIANGIKPDIVCAADSSYENSLDFVGVEDETEVILAAELMTHPDIFKVFKGPKMLVSFGGGLFQQIASYREEIGSLICWGSVATTAFDLARKTGADPIIFVGLDLSFYDGRLHTKGSYSDDILYEKLHPFTSIENETSDYICERGHFQFMGANGKLIYTDTNMKAYKEWFEDAFAKTSAKIINATEGGIVDKSVERMKLSDTIEKYFDKGTDVRKILTEQIGLPVETNVTGLIESFENIRGKIAEFAKQIKLLLPICEKLLEKMETDNVTQFHGKEQECFATAMELHDRICDCAVIVPWFASLHTKFVTKHTSDVIRLRNSKDATNKKWLKVVMHLFSEFDSFANYQLPLVDNAMFELRKKCVKI